MDDTSETLATLAQHGNEQAAADLVERFYQKIYAYLRRQTLNNEDAFDLTQKVFS
ncbi:MAG: RNA polymerase subunit sigma-70, partial [Verrucomicrobia bacterium]|nr:RNA polymerase subunit sigma-70 [Verrucomicrobiota bacterium]